MFKLLKDALGRSKVLAARSKTQAKAKANADRTQGDGSLVFTHRTQGDGSLVFTQGQNTGGRFSCVI